MKRRVVITGLGVLCAAGEGHAALWKQIQSGESAIRPLCLGEGQETFETLAGVVPDFCAEKYIEQRKSLKVMARDIQLAVASAKLAYEDARFPKASIEKTRAGVIVGSGVLDHELDELAYSVQQSLDSERRLDLKRFGEDGMGALFPLWLLKYLPNMPACHISILFDFQGPNNTLTSGASAALQAIGEAFFIIQRGHADVMLAGGAESKTNAHGLSQYQVMRVLSKAKEPSAYRPFESGRDGFIAGEGAAFLVLEEYERARSRGATIYAEIGGFGSSFYDGRRQALKAAVDDAKITAKDIDFVQGSGIGLDADDSAELEAMRAFFPSEVSAGLLKPVVGFTGFAAGAVDAASCALAVKEQTVPPSTQNRSVFPFRFHPKPVKQPIRNALVNTFGFNGQAASLVLKSGAAS